MFSKVITLQFIASLLSNILLYIEIMVASREARLNAQEALDFILSDKDFDEKGIIGEEEEFESSTESEFEYELDDINVEPEMSGTLAPRTRQQQTRSS